MRSECTLKKSLYRFFMISIYKCTYMSFLHTHPPTHTHTPPHPHTHFFVTPCPLRTVSRSQAESISWVRSHTRLPCAGDRWVPGRYRPWGCPTSQPIQAQGVRWKVVEEGEDTCACRWSSSGQSLFTERRFLLAKIPDARTVIPLGIEEHVQ